MHSVLVDLEVGRNAYVRVLDQALAEIGVTMQTASMSVAAISRLSALTMRFASSSSSGVVLCAAVLLITPPKASRPDPGSGFREGRAPGSSAPAR